MTRRVDTLFAAWSKEDSPGCAVGVIQREQFVYRRGYGMANLELGVPISSGSVFYIASASKQFTAAAIALLVLDGRLSLNDSLRTYLPELPASVYGEIRVRHLVYHTSGIRDYLELMDLGAARVEDVFTAPDALQLLSRQRALNFTPGARHLYSNSNYLLLGLIVQKVTGQSLREYAKAQIFEPLGMHSTQFRDDIGVVVKNRVSSYLAGPDGHYSAYHTNFALVGDGGLLTSVEDLLLWDRNFYQDQLRGGRLPPLLQSTGTLDNGDKLDYAFGLTLSEYRGLKTVSHAGAFNHFVAELVRFPEQRFSAIVLCNSYGPSAPRLAQQIADFYLAKELAPMPPDEALAWRNDAVVTIADAELSRRVGTYRHRDSGTTWEITQQGGKLISAVQGLRFALEPLSSTRFRAVDAPLQIVIEFQPADRGEAEFRVFIPGQKTNSFQMQRSGEFAGTKLAQYFARYCSDEIGACYLVSAVEGKLHIKPAFDYSFSPFARDIFRAENGSVVRFTRDRKGHVDGMRLDGQRVLDVGFHICPRRGGADRICECWTHSHSEMR